jgi:hypothetical protein
MRLNPPETLVILFGPQGTSGSFDRKKEKGEDVRFRTILAQGQPFWPNPGARLSASIGAGDATHVTDATPLVSFRRDDERAIFILGAVSAPHSDCRSARKRTHADITKAHGGLDASGGGLNLRIRR